MKRKLTIVLISLLMALNGYTTLPANDIHLTISAPATASCGDQITATVNVDGFNDLMSLDFSINWDDTQLGFVTFTYTVINGSPPLYGLPGDGLNDNEFTYGWISMNLSGDNLPDGSTLLSITFEVLTSSGSGSVSLTDSPTPRDASDVNFSPVTVNFVSPASISFQPIAAPTPGTTVKSFIWGSPGTVGLAATGVSVQNSGLINTQEDNHRIVWKLTNKPANSAYSIGDQFTTDNCSAAFKSFGELAVANNSRVIRVNNMAPSNGGNPIIGTYVFETYIENCLTGCMSDAVGTYSITVETGSPAKLLVTDTNGNPIPNPQLQNIPFDVRVTLSSEYDLPLPNTGGDVTITLTGNGGNPAGDLRVQGFPADPVTALLPENDSFVNINNVLYTGLSELAGYDIVINAVANGTGSAGGQTGTSDLFSVRGIFFTVVADPVSIPADALSASQITVTLTDVNDPPNPVVNNTVTVSTSRGVFVDGVNILGTSVQTVTDGNGEVTLQLRSGIEHGPVTITALCPGACPATATLVFTKSNVINQTQQAGYVTITDAITAAGVNDIILISQGEYQEDVDTGGKQLKLVPGNSSGTVTITGTLTLGSGDFLEMEIFSDNDFDKFVVTGNLNLGGATLLLITDASYQPVAGTEISIFEYGSLENEFSNTSLVVSNTDVSFIIDYVGSGNEIILKNVRRLMRLLINTPAFN